MAIRSACFLYGNGGVAFDVTFCYHPYRRPCIDGKLGVISVIYVGIGASS